MTTIAWRIAHLVVGVLGARNAAHFGGPARRLRDLDVRRARPTSRSPSSTRATAAGSRACAAWARTVSLDRADRPRDRAPTHRSPRSSSTSTARSSTTAPRSRCCATSTLTAPTGRLSDVAHRPGHLRLRRPGRALAVLERGAGLPARQSPAAVRVVGGGPRRLEHPRGEPQRRLRLRRPRRGQGRGCSSRRCRRASPPRTASTSTSAPPPASRATSGWRRSRPSAQSSSPSAPTRLRRLEPDAHGGRDHRHAGPRGQRVLPGLTRALVEEGRSPVTRPRDRTADLSPGFVTGASAPSSTSGQLSDGGEPPVALAGQQAVGDGQRQGPVEAFRLPVLRADERPRSSGACGPCAWRARTIWPIS